LYFDGFFGEPIAINGDLEFGAEARQALDVVVVLVGDEDAVKTLGRTADGRQTLSDLPAAEPRVNQEARLFGFEVGAIPG
jgi:hypothetical protein